MRCQWLYLTVLLVWLTPVSFAAAEDRKKPNIVIIMADDMGFSDLGCYGSEISTPHLDRLAKSGLRFTHFYNCARCCPTRAALLTGVYPHQAGVGHMVEDLGIPSYQGYLNDRCVTIAEVLKMAGYRTYTSGKWHVGDQRPHWPVDRGFEHAYSLINSGRNYFRLDPDRLLARDDKLIEPPEKWYVTDAITDNAVSFLQDHGKTDKPFFLYVPYTAPHWPLQALREDIAKYRGKYLSGWDALRQARHKRQIALGLIDGRWPLTPRDATVPEWKDAPNHEAWDLKMAIYAAQIDRLDQGVGKILAQIKANGVESNTLVLFLSDNGGCAEIIDYGKADAPIGTMESYKSYGVGWANASNTPFRLYKHWVHEGGIATPLIAYWPATIKRPSITNQVGHVLDLSATCYDLAGAEYPKRIKDRDIIPLEGTSLLPILQGKTQAAHETLFWEHEGNRAVRQGNLKLVAEYKKKWGLYDLAADRTELHDLAGTHPEKVKELVGLYEQWAKRCGVVPWKEIEAKAK